MRGEKVKMLAGELYDPWDPALAHERQQARQRCHDLNVSSPLESDQRRGILQSLFATGGDTVLLEPPFHCDYGSNIHLGQGVYFNFNCVVLDVCAVTIGSHTLFGPGVHLYTATHPLNAELRRTQEYGRPITIGTDVWVGGGAIICPGVTIGDRTVIGAGSVVTRSIPADVLAVGNPCRVARKLAAEDHRQEDFSD